VCSAACAHADRVTARRDAAFPVKSTGGGSTPTGNDRPSPAALPQFGFDGMIGPAEAWPRCIVGDVFLEASAGASGCDVGENSETVLTVATDSPSHTMRT